MRNNTKKFVVKVGSALVVDEHSGIVNQEWLNSLAHNIIEIQRNGHEVILVSSGAIALARKDFTDVNGSLPLKQALSTIGQPLLMSAYTKAFNSPVSQVLLTANDLKSESGLENFKHTITALNTLGVIPIINENDAVATEEIKFGDNDKLAALVAEFVGADELIIFTRSKGLFTSDPETNPDALHIAEIKGHISEEFKNYAEGTLNHLSTGGMKTKLDAAEIAMNAGIKTYIASGTMMYPISTLKGGREKFTVCIPE